MVGSQESRSGKATIYSIAREVGISPSTVSRAFSRPHMVKDDVRERIFKVAERQQYYANRHARGLATGRTGVIGVAVFDITNPFMPPLIRALDHAARSQDLAVMLLDSGGDSASDKEALEHFSRNVDGLILAAPHLTAAEIRNVSAATPTVLINREIAGLSSVVCDNSGALWAAADHAVALGHQSILLMTGPSGSWAAEQRTCAIREWARQSPESVRLLELGPWEATFEAGKNSVSDVLETGTTAILAFDDFFACGVVAGFVERGVSVPDEVSVIGCDDVLLARTITPQLTTVTAPFDALGKEAVELLMQAIKGQNIQRRVLRGEFVARGSTGPVCVEQT